MKKLFLTALVVFALGSVALAKPILVLGQSSSNPCIGFWVVIDDKTGVVYGGGTYNKCAKKSTYQKNALEVAKQSISNEKITKQLILKNAKEVDIAEIKKHLQTLAN